MPRAMIDSAEMQALAHFLDLSSFRTQLITSNLANIDTPGYGLRVKEVFSGSQLTM